MPVRLVVERGPYAGLSRADVVRRARAMLHAVRLENAELSLLLTDDDGIQELNRIYRKKNKPTDVLSFSQIEGAAGVAPLEAGGTGQILGDVVVSIPTARRQAESRRRDVVSEVTTLLAHGLLHLLGWDHATAAEDRRMRRETDRLCAAADAAAHAFRGQPPRSSGSKRKTAVPSRGDSVGRRVSRMSRTPR